MQTKLLLSRNLLPFPGFSVSHQVHCAQLSQLSLAQSIKIKEDFTSKEKKS